MDAPLNSEQPPERSFRDRIMDTLYVYRDGADQPIASVTKDAEGALYVIPHQGSDVKAVETVVLGAKTLEASAIIAACRAAGFEATQTLRAPLEQRDATPLERREARFIHESNLIEGVSEQPYDTILADLKRPKETGHTEAWKLARLLAHDRTPLTLESVLEMHRLLTTEQVQLGHPIDPKFIGKVRDVPVEIGGAIKSIPSEKDLKNLIEEISSEVSAVRDDDLEVLLRLVALQHLRFEDMHPFADGNGRIGRILINYVLAYFRHPPLVITDQGREDYYACFPERGGRQEDMEKFFLKKYKEF